jgi:beta-lactamase class A
MAGDRVPPRERAARIAAARRRRLGGVLSALGAALLCVLLASGGRMVLSAFDSVAVATSDSTPAAGLSSAAPGATGGASAAPSGSHAARTRPPHTLAPVTPSGSPIDAAVASVIAAAGANPADVTIAAYDMKSTASYQYSSATDFVTASIVKVDILAALLLQHQDAGTQLSEDESTLAEEMIENSDNDAASELYDQIGDAEGLSAANVRLGLAHTVPGTDGEWGVSTTSAADQLQLITDIVGDTGPLSTASRQLILSLMSQVESDQSWGISAAADPGSTTALKNGWDQDDNDGSWMVNSIGRISAGGHVILLAILTSGSDTMDEGIALVEQLARAVAPTLATR